MNITRDVITDLWTLYAAGEASPDTRSLVETFLERDPEFAKQLREQGVEHMLQHASLRLSPDQETRALRRTKRKLRGWDWTLFMAMIFSGFAFGRIISDTSWDVSPKNFIATASIAAAFWVAFFVRMLLAYRKVFRVEAEGKPPGI